MNKEEDIKKLEDIICIVCKGKSPTHTEIIEKIKFYWASVFPDEKYTQDDLNEINRFFNRYLSREKKLRWMRLDNAAKLFSTRQQQQMTL